ncbi:hypothetical protein [Mesonia maritima]|uniref:Uncharacterized protein n=1 Tax=Mesonia maritima TaxID=1793873 RepID=A0ABU1K6T3_9FLAO|nr:hypothetical protein [Mesonia maritima]MDR6301314.1 hypothetical protein [Mesonia maritima]
MKNTLKIALLVVGLGLIGYGIYTVLFPHISLKNGSEKIAPEYDNIQSFSMIAFGILCFVSGLAFKKR